MKGIGRRVREIRDSRGMTQQELANKSHRCIGYISKLETEVEGYINPTIEVIEALASALEVHPNEILYGSDQDLAQTLQSHSVSENELITEFKEIPLLSGAITVESITQDFSNWNGPTIKIPRWVFDGADVIGWKIKGSLEDRYLDEDILVISKDIRIINEFDVIVPKENEPLTVKKLKTYPDGTIELRPYNSDFPTIQVQHSDEVEIVGKIVGLFRDMERKKR